MPAAQDVVEHRARSVAGERVLLARVVAADQADGRAARTAEPLRRRDRTGRGRGRGIAPRCDQAPRARARRTSPAHDEDTDGPASAPPTGPAMARRRRARLGLGAFPGGAHRTAATPGRRPAAARRQRERMWSPSGQAGPVQRGEQPVAAAVTGEDPAGSVAAVRARVPGRRSICTRRALPQPGTGRPQYGSSANDLRLALATCSRHCTSRGQARHTDDRAVNSQARHQWQGGDLRGSCADRRPGRRRIARPSGTRRDRAGKSPPIAGCGRLIGGQVPRAARAPRRSHRGCRSRWRSPRRRQHGQ